MKILVLKRDKLGDLLLTTPLFAQLRAHWPQARIDLLASHYNAWVAQGNTDLDTILSYRRVRGGSATGSGSVLAAAWDQLRLFVKLRQQHYDVVIVGQGEDSPRAVERALWVGARRVISYVEPGHRYGRRLTDALVPPQSGHEAQRLLGLLQPLGVTAALGSAAPQFHLPGAAQESARAWLAEQGLSDANYVVLGLGARRARKQPSTEQLVRWITRLSDQFGLRTVFMWTPGERTNPLYPGDDDIANPVLAAAPTGLVPFRGPLLPALGLVWRARTSIFPDSGLMHFASASPGGVLGLFGDSEDFLEKWRPLGERSRWLRAAQVSLLGDEEVFRELAALIAARGTASAGVAQTSSGKA
jgi:ADP-heptose:LPS heptosyltransferase